MSTNESTAEDRCTALVELPGLVKKVLADPEISQGVAAQVHWVEGTLYRALQQDDFRSRYGNSLRDLLGPGATALCRMTEAGELRAKELKTPPKGVTASLRRRSSILRRLAEAAGVPSGAISYPKAGLKPTMPSWASSELHHRVAEEVERRPAAPGKARFLAVVGLVLDTRARTGELCAIRITDLAPGLDGVKITRNPQADTVTTYAPEAMRLSSTTQAALAQWLPIRQHLVADLEGSADALLVVLRSNRGQGDAPYLQGMPLRPKGLIGSYRTHVQELKEEATRRGGSGWELPEGLEQLRRAVEEQQRAATPGALRVPAATPKKAGAAGQEARPAQAFGELVTSVEAYVAARADAGDETAPRVLRARASLREATWTAWARSDHATTLLVLRQAGLDHDNLAAAGYDERLLAALERA